MSADSFHAKVEKEMNKMKMVCDWEDFLTCVRRAGDVRTRNERERLGTIRKWAKSRKTIT